MEPADGESLRARLTRGPLTVHESVSVLRGVADALARAHAEGITHGDVRPSKVLLTQGAASAGVELVDFGVDKERTLTATGEVVGAPKYMSPEQCQGEGPSPAADLYSLGVMAFECVTGRLPFTGDAAAVLTQHMRVPPPRVRALEPTVPEALDDLIDRLLAKDPRNRIPDAATVGKILDRALGSLPPPRPSLVMVSTLTLEEEAMRVRLTAALEVLHEDARRKCAVLAEMDGHRREALRVADAAFATLDRAWLALRGMIDPMSGGNGVVPSSATAELGLAVAGWRGRVEALTRGEAEVLKSRQELADLEFQINELRGRLATLGVRDTAV